MSKQSIGLASAVLLFCLAATTAAQPIGALRPEGRDVRKMIEEAVRQSATFQNVSERLNATNVVVHVRFGRCPGAVAACTHFIGSQGTIRRLLIVLDRFGRSPWDLMALLAHELQHALEIAEAASVVDAPSFHHFYETTGRKVSEGYETEAAIRAGRAVASELTKHRPH